MPIEQLLRTGKADDAVARLSNVEIRAMTAAIERKYAANAGGATTDAAGNVVEHFTRPQGAQWAKLFVRTALPFFAFGVCDNIIMLSVGDLIDEHFGVVMGFSTLVAAGLGQAVSDGSGVTIQCLIERHAERLRWVDPRVDPAYLETRGAQRLLQLFRTIGIVCGCLCGLTPLIFMDRGNKPRLYDMLLNDVPEEHRRRISANAYYVTLPKGSHIVQRGDEVTAIDTVVTGEVSVIGRDSLGEPCHICDEGPGFGIGFLEVVFGHDSVADVVVISDEVKLLRIDKSHFETIAAEPTVRAALDRHIHENEKYAPYLMTRPAAKVVSQKQATPAPSP